MAKVQCFGLPGLHMWFWSNDHDPPHFHVKREGEWEIKIKFAEGEDEMFEQEWGSTPERKGSSAAPKVGEAAPGGPARRVGSEGRPMTARILRNPLVEFIATSSRIAHAYRSAAKRNRILSRCAAIHELGQSVTLSEAAKRAREL